MSSTVLFLELFQPFAQYRNPFTFYYAQTYPLPPRSTVIGMLQNALDDWYGNSNSWDELKISIHGEFENSFWNYQNMIKGYPFIKNGKLIIEDEDGQRSLYGEGKKAQRSPVYQQELFNGRLFIFLKGREELLNDLYNVLKQPKKVLTLGRSEDIIFIRRIARVDNVDNVKRISIKGDIKIPHSTYIIEKGFPIENKKYPVFYIPLSSKFKNNGRMIKYKYELKVNSTKRDVIFESVIYIARDYSIVLKEGCRIEVDYYRIGEVDHNHTNNIYPIIDKWGWL